MELMQLIAPSLLLFHVVCPFVAGVLLACGAIRSTVHARWLSIGTNLVLTGTALVLFVFLNRTPLPGVTSIQFVATLPTVTSTSDLVHYVIWGLIPSTGGLLCLVPWVAITALLLTPSEEFSVARHRSQLLSVAALGLLITGWDIGSMLTGTFLSAALIAEQICLYGRDERRSASRLFLTYQVIGGFLLAAGISMIIASLGVVRSAPRGVPGDSVASLPELMSLLQGALESHPAASQLWGEYRTVPCVLMLLGIGIMAAIFPVQVWMSEVIDSSSLPERLWLIFRVKAILLIGLRWVNILVPETFHGLTWWGLVISAPGAVFVASLLFSQAYLPRIQSSAVMWTQQLAFMIAFAATTDFDTWMGALLVSQLAGLVLLTITLTTITDRFRSIELASYQGLSAQAGWIAPALVSCCLILTLTPLGLGLLNLWLMTATLQGSGAPGEVFLRGCFFVANLLALAGLVRVTRTLLTGERRVPEMSPILLARIGETPPVRTLELTGVQMFILMTWGMIALITGIWFPLRYVSF
jgi:hypothetical protein